MGVLLTLYNRRRETGMTTQFPPDGRCAFIAPPSLPDVYNAKINVANMKYELI